MKLSLVVPMYNEASIICDTARTLTDYLQKHFDDYELLFVDDGSTDGSALMVKKLQLPKVQVLGYVNNRGKGCAVRTGMLAATGDIAMFIDADLAYGMDVIPQAVKLLGKNRGKDVLTGSRVLHPEGYEGYTALRKLASKIYIRVLNVYGGLTLSDSQCGCKAYRGSAIKDIFSRCETDGFAFDFETILWAQKLGYQFVEMPVKVINHRDSKINVVRDTFRMLGELRQIKRRIRNSSATDK